MDDKWPWQAWATLWIVVATFLIAFTLILSVFNAQNTREVTKQIAACAAHHGTWTYEGECVVPR